MALRTARAKPAKPRRAITSPHKATARTAQPSQRPKPPVLKALSNLSTLSGGTQPGAQGQDQGMAPWESTDPILQQIKALQLANVASAEAGALAARSKVLEQFGYDPELEKSGVYGDKGVAATAKANPFSILEQLKRGHLSRQTNLNENENKNNLWYSGHRGKVLEEEGRNYLGEQTNARSALMGTLGDINDSLLGARRDAQDAIAGGQQDASNRFLQNQLNYGLGGGGTTPAPRRALPRPRRITRTATRTALRRY